MKVYKTYNKAKDESDGGIIVQCGDFYIVGMKTYDPIAVIEPNGFVSGTSPSSTAIPTAVVTAASL